jgi:hypothetical protein
MIFSTALSAATAGRTPRQAASYLAGLFGAGYTILFTRNGASIATTSATALENNGRDGIWMRGELVLPNTVAASGAWKARVSVTGDPLMYAELDITEDGIDGWIRSSPVAGATLSWAFTIKTERIVPAGVHPLSLGRTKFGGWNDSAIPANDQAAIGDMQYSRVIKLYDLFDDVSGTVKWDSINGSGYVDSLEVSLNGGAYISLSGVVSVPIVEGDVVQFRAPAVAGTPGLSGAGNTKTIWLSGPSTANTPYISWYFVLANAPSGASTTYTVGNGQTYATPEALSLAGVLKAGDTVDLLGQDFPGFKIRQSGAPGAEITWRTKPGEAQQARITYTLGYGEAFTSPGSQIAEARYLVWGNNLVSHQRFSNLKLTAGRGVSSDRTARFVFEQRGHNWIFEDNHVYDSLMGFHSSDYYSGTFIARRNWLDNVGQLSAFNSHSIYLNADVAAWPDMINLIEYNLITNASAQGVALRATHAVVRHNWIEMNQDVTDPSAEVFWTITPNGSGGYNYTGGPQGSGVSGQFAIVFSGPENRENNPLYRRPVAQAYGNVIRGSINTGTIVLGGDTSGFNGYASGYVVHNTITLPPGRSPYLTVFRQSQTPYSCVWDNNLVAAENSAPMAMQNTWTFGELQPNARWPISYARSNALPNGAEVYWAQPGAGDPPSFESISRQLHQKGTIWHQGSPIVNQTVGNINAAPAAGSVVVGAAAPLVFPGTAAMPSYALPIDLTLGMWSTKPTYPLAPPAAGTANTNIGAIKGAGSGGIGNAGGSAAPVASPVQDITAVGVFPIPPLGAPIITSTNSASGQHGVAGTFQATATGGTPPYTWALSSAPAGVTINPSTGLVSWTVGVP